MASPAAVLSILVEANTSAANANLAKTNAELDATKASAVATTGATSKTGSAMRKLGTAAKWGGAALAVGFVVEAKKAVTSTQDLTKTTLTLHKNLALTVKQSSEWGAALKARGADSQKAGMAFKTFATQLSAAGHGSATSIAMFKELGFSQQDIQKSMTNTQFALGKVSDGLNHLPAGADKATFAGKLFGRGWQTVAPILRDGSGAMQDVLNTQEKYGAFLEGKGFAQQKTLLQNIKDNKSAWLGLQVQLATVVTPTLNAVSDQFQHIAAIMADPKLTQDEKFTKVADIIQKDMSTALDVIVKMIPTIASRVGEQAPKIASGLVNGFLDSNVWGKLLIGSWLISKLGGAGALRSVGSKAAAPIAAGMASGVEENTAATAAFGTRVKGALGGALKTAGRVAGIAGGIAAVGGIVGTLSEQHANRSITGVLQDFGINAFRTLGINLGQTTAEQFTDAFKAKVQTISLTSFMRPGIITNAQIDAVRQQIAKRVGESGHFAAGSDALANAITQQTQHALSKLHPKMPNAKDLFGDLWDQMTPDERQFAHQLRNAAIGASDLLKSTHIDLPAGLIRTDPKTALKFEKQLKENFSVLKNVTFASLTDIQRVTDKNLSVIDKLYPQHGQKWRDAMHSNMDAQVEAIRHGMARGEVGTQEGLAKIHDLIAKAKIIDPTRKQAQGFADQWAKGIQKAGSLTDHGVQHIITSLGKMPPAAKNIAAKTLLAHLDELKQENKLTDKQYDKMRSSILSHFTDIKNIASDQTVKTVGSVLGSYSNLSHGVKVGLDTIRGNVNQALKGLGLDKAVQFRTQEAPIGAGGVGHRAGAQRGAAIVPGTGSGDKVPVTAMTEPGEGLFVLNRNAMGVLQSLNQKFPRFAVGGTAGMQPAAKQLATQFVQRFGGAISSGLRAGDTGSFHSQGLAFDWVPGNASAATRYANQIGAQLLEGIHNPAAWGSSVSWDSGKQVPSSFWGSATWADHIDHLHVAVSGAVKAAATKIARMILKGPKGSLTDMGQASLDKTWRAANRFIAKNMPTQGIEVGVSGAAGTLSPQEFLRIANQAIKVTRSPGFSASGLLSLAEQESGLRVNPPPPHDINWPNNPSMGLMQLTGSNFSAYHQPGTSSSITNPLANIAASINYQKAKYGHQVTFSPYKLGGMVMPPFGGSFGNGGVVGGPVGAPRTIIAHGGEKVERRPSRYAITITNWQEGTGYMEEVADGAINGTVRLNRQKARMRR